MDNPYLGAQKFADLCGTTKDTLRHYDEIGLLKPIMTTSNNYRFYALAQVYTYDIIHILTSLGCPLQEIKEKLNSASKEQLLSYLKATDAMILAKRKRLLQSMLLLENNNDFSHSFNSEKMTQPSTLIQQHNEFLLLTPLPEVLYKDISTASALCLQPHNKQCQALGVYPFPIGHIINHDSFLAGKHTRTHIYSHIPDIHNTSGYGSIKYAGKYAVIIHNGSYLSIQSTYDRLLSFLQEHHYHLKGDLYELNISHHIFGYQDDDAYFYISAQIEES